MFLEGLSEYYSNIDTQLSPYRREFDVCHELLELCRGADLERERDMGVTYTRLDSEGSWPAERWMPLQYSKFVMTRFNPGRRFYGHDHGVISVLDVPIVGNRLRLRMRNSCA